MAKRPRSQPRSPRDVERTRLFWRTVLVAALSLGLTAVVYFVARVSRNGAEHSHDPAARGGVVVSLGDDQDHYHVEAVVAGGRYLTLYPLAEEAKRMLEVEAQVLTARVKLEGDAVPVPVLLMPVPRPGDADGRTSRFVGKLPEDRWGRRLVVAVDGVTIAGKRFPVNFTVDPSVPAQEAHVQEERLYRAPAGRYTQADITANGGTTAAQRFKEFHATHDLKPEPGDRVCPVTRIKADRACAWVVDGKTYQFCCPPCVDEFVATAKKQPREIREPEDYVKK